MSQKVELKLLIKVVNVMEENSHPHVLIVDDNEFMRQMLQMTFESESMEVDTCDNGEAAIRSCRKKQYHLIVTDLHMPILDGLEFVARLRKAPQYQMTPVIILSSDDRAYDNHANVRSKPFTDWFIKTKEPENLAAHAKKRIEESLIAQQVCIDATVPTLNS